MNSEVTHSYCTKCASLSSFGGNTPPVHKEAIESPTNGYAFNLPDVE